MDNNNRNNKKKNKKILVVYAILLGFLISGFFIASQWNKPKPNYNYSDFQRDITDGKIAGITIRQNEEVPTGQLELTFNDNTKEKLYVSDVNKVEDYLNKAGKAYKVDDVTRESAFLSTIIPIIIMIVGVGFLFFFMTKSAGGGGRMSTFSKSKAKRDDSKLRKVTFADVAGLDEEKSDLEQIVDFLREPRKYIKLGARIPKGVILTGPPGTGKTLLAKAVAGEAGVPFFTISGSDFVEMFVGVGASRVRDMFTEAKKNAPCIIFIDEIDAVARKRGTGLGGGHDEREQTLNQLLVEMDGFDTNSGIIVMAATNRLDILDPAILRPGRFDRKIYVGRPDTKARLEILKVHARKKPLSDDVDLESLAKTTMGFAGADLENVMNEAAILAASNDREMIVNKDIEEAFIKEGIGTEKRSRVVIEKERKITAYHESGHAILFHLLPDVGPVHLVSIIPTGHGAGGYTMPLPESEELFNTRGKMLQNIIVAFGGRVAEELIFDDITTGASQDIKQATAIARDMVTKYGFSSELGPINYEISSDEVFIGNELGHTKSYSENVAAKIDSEVRRIVEECYQKAKELISEHRSVLDESSKLLLEKEKISREEFESLFNKDQLVGEEG